MEAEYAYVEGDKIKGNSRLLFHIWKRLKKL